MKIDELLSMWKADSRLNGSNLSHESERLYELHSKYLDLYTQQRMVLKIQELDLKKLNLDKHEFLLHGPTQETKELGWEYPTSGKVVRTDFQLYRDADKQVREAELQYEKTKVIVDALQSILDSIKFRGNIIGNMIKREIFLGGM